MTRPKKKRGRYRKPRHTGLPNLTVRLDPEVRERIKSHPEKPRAYIERLVRDDMERDG